jgi:hypothetical protein
MQTVVPENEDKNQKQENEQPQFPLLQSTRVISQERRRFVKMRGLYPKGGPKIVRQEFERLGFIYLPGNAPNG